MNTMKDFLVKLLVLLLIVSPFQIQTSQVYAEDIKSEATQSENITIKTSLEKESTTKVDKLTFDTWVRNQKDDKIETKYISVTNNGENVPINWDDDEKTSYTLDLAVGENKINIVVDYSGVKITESFKIFREEAEDGDVIGSVTFSMDAFTIGLGYIIEPVKIDLVKGERASELLVQTLEEYGFDYDHTGTLHSSFYLAAIIAAENEIYKVKPSIPEALKEELNGIYNENQYMDNYLGEFDFSQGSGWMFAVNNVFPNVGYADYYLKDDDVMRTQFTLALGSDIGGGWGNNFFDSVNKDELTKQIAEINTYHREEYLQYETMEEAYDYSLEILQKVNATQVEIDGALQELIDAENYILDSKISKEVMNKIDELPSDEKITLSDSEKVSSAREAYDSLTKGQQKLVSNVDKLESLEQRLDVLAKEEENEEEDDEKQAEELKREIDTLPSVGKIALSHQDNINGVRTKFESLSTETKKYITNINKLEMLEKRLVQLQERQDYEVEKQKLENKLADALKVDLSKSTNDSVQKLGISVGKAENILSKSEKAMKGYPKISMSAMPVSESSQFQGLIDAFNELQHAIENMEEQENLDNEDSLVKNHLIFEVKRLEQYELEDVSEEEQKEIEEILSKGNELIEEEVVKVKDIENIVSRAREEVEELKKQSIIDKGNLKDFFEIATEIDQTKYTSATVDVLDSAIDNAGKVLENPDVSEEEVNKVAEILQTAIDSLKFLANKEALQQVFDTAKDYSTSKKPKGLVERFNEARDIAEKVLEDQEATEEEVNEAIDALERAMKDLENVEIENDVDKKDLQEKYDGAEKIDLTLKSDESKAKFNEARENAEKVLTNKNATKEDIEQALQKLHLAIEELEDIDVKEPEEDDEGNNQEENEKEEGNGTPSKDNEEGKQEGKVTDKKNQEKEESKSTTLDTDNSTSKQTKNEKESNETLPKTATPMYSMIFIGLMLLLSGMAYFIFQKLARRKRI